MVDGAENMGEGEVARWQGDEDMVCVYGNDEGRWLENSMFAPRNPYIPFCCLYDDKTVRAFFKFRSGSQVFSAEEYPFQDTR